MYIVFTWLSSMPLEMYAMFSPADVAPIPQVRSTFGPLVCERYPWSAIRCAFCCATLARQSLQASDPSPLAARSWLINVWSTDPLVAACAGGVATIGDALAGTSDISRAEPVAIPVNVARRMKDPIAGTTGPAARSEE